MPSRFRYRTLDAHFTRSCDVIDYVTNQFVIGQFLLVVYSTILSLAVLRHLHVNISGSRSWHFEVTWCHRLCEIMGPKHFGVTTWLFTWPIGPPYAICYWLSIDTEALSVNVFEIFDPQIKHNSQLAHDDCRRIRSTIWKLTKQTP